MLFFFSCTYFIELFFLYKDKSASQQASSHETANNNEINDVTLDEFMEFFKDPMDITSDDFLQQLPAGTFDSMTCSIYTHMLWKVDDIDFSNA